MITTRSSRPSEWRGRLAPSLLLVFLAALTLLLVVSHLFSLQRSRVLVRHSEGVIEAARSLVAIVSEAESDERGFLATGDSGFVGNYDQARARVSAANADLKRLVADEPDQAVRAARLSATLNRRIALSDQRVKLAQASQLEQARHLNIGLGRRLMGQANASLTELTQSEMRELKMRNAQADRLDLTEFIVGLALSALSILGLAAMMASMGRANRRLQHEIVEREAAEAARREGEALYQAVFDTTADLLYVLEALPDGRFVLAEANPAYQRAVGASAADLRGVNVAWLTTDDDRSTLLEHLKSVGRSDQAVFSRDRVLLPGGERIWESVLTPLHGEHGRVERIVGSSRDVTERENAQEQTRRVQRLEAVGHLTGGIAHDFNNLLQVIRGNLELISAQIGDGPGSARISNALHAAERAAQLTRQLLAFARRQPLEPRVVDLGRLVRDMGDSLRRTLGEQVTIETMVADGLWNTLADPDQVESAVLNLALNARDAMPRGGRLRLEITNAVLGDDGDRRGGEFEPGQYVLIAVSDTGAGMDREVLKRAFEPFFTTKSQEKGTGLGLSMVYGFVKQSHGHVQIFSEPGQGATVKLFLPRSRQAQAAEPSPAPSASPMVSQGHSEVILVVEDDDLVRASAVSMLGELGYSCLQAADAADAQSLIRSKAKIDLLFTDVIMPGPVKCRDMAREAQSLRPTMPILFTSGYSQDVIVHDGRLDEGVQLLSKPYTRADLARKIGALLKPRRPVVLVVEDDPLVRMAAVDMVEALGFVPLQAGDAPGALSLLGGGGPIDVLFTDVGLPGVRGTELAVQARVLRPDLRIVFASGYGEIAEAAAIPGATHLRKPYEQDELAEALAPA